jgi:hypothetical protein
MKKLLLIVLLALCGQVVAGGTYSRFRVGDIDYWDGPHGYEATGQRIGDFYYLDGSYLDCNGERHHFSGTGYRIPDLEYFDLDRND